MANCGAALIHSRLTDQPRSRGEIGEGFGRELVGVFGMQPFAGLERKGVLGGIHNLIGAADQMHFDAVSSAFRSPDDRTRQDQNPHQAHG